MIPHKYGIAFTQLAAMNTATALVKHQQGRRIGRVTHGGVEMGQGLHTKIAQVAANELASAGISASPATTASDRQAPATAASTGFDLNGGAVAQACRAPASPARRLLRGQ